MASEKVLTLNMDLQETNNPCIGIYFGMYTSYGNRYTYRIPQFIADTESAKQLNSLIIAQMLPHMGYSGYATEYEVFEYRDSTYELETAKGLTIPDLPMYLDADGTLKVFVPIPNMVTDWYWGFYEVADGNLR